MLRYMNFLWATLFKRAFVYVLLGVYAVIMIGIMYLFTSLGGSSKEVRPVSFTSYPNSFIAWFAFIFCTLFMCLVVIHVFKKQEAEGTELLISAKPISRTNIVFGKIFVVLLALVGFAVVSFVVFFVGALLDKQGTNTRALKYAGGLFIGVIITGLLFTSVILLFGTILKKTGLMVISTLIPVGIFVLNMSAVPATKAIAPNLNGDSNYSVIYNENNNIKVKNIYVNNPKTSSRVNSSIKENIDTKYNIVKYFDLWGQWNNSFLILQPIPQNGGGTGFYKTAQFNARQPRENDLLKMTAKDGHSYAIQLPTVYKTNISMTLDIFNEIQNTTKSIILKATPTDSLRDDLSKIYKEVISKNPKVAKYLKNEKDDDQRSGQIANVIASVVLKVPKYNGVYDATTNDHFFIKDASALTSKDSYIVMGTKPFLNTTYVNLFWIVIALGLTGLAILIYLRRDFK